MFIQQSMNLLILLMGLITPYLFSFRTHEGYEMPKTFFIYIISLLLLGLFCVGVFEKKVKLQKPYVGSLLYLAFVFLSTLLSTHFYTSFWGYYSRFNGGLLSFLCLFLIYLIVRSIKSSIFLSNFIKGILLSSLVISIFAILQHFSGVPRVYSTFGHPNWLAQYYSLILPLVLLIYVKKKHLSYLWLSVYLFGYTAFWFTYSLSGLFGLISGMIVMLIYIITRFPLLKRRVVLPLVLSLIVSLMFMGLYSLKISDMFIDVKKKLSLTQYAYAQESTYQLSDPGSIRFGLWKGTLNIISRNKKILLLGSGLETFPYVFSLERPLELNYSSEWDYVFNKPHNYYLEILFEIGIFGFFTYIFLIITVIRKAPFWMLPFWISYLVTNFFGWPSVYVNLLFWIFLGISQYEKDIKF